MLPNKKYWTDVRTRPGSKGWRVSNPLKNVYRKCLMLKVSNVFFGHFSYKMNVFWFRVSFHKNKQLSIYIGLYVIFLQVMSTKCQKWMKQYFQIPNPQSVAVQHLRRSSLRRNLLNNLLILKKTMHLSREKTCF